MDHHAVLPSDFQAGGDSKREELCQQDPQPLTITAAGASSSLVRVEAAGASSSGRSGAVKGPPNTGEGNVHPQTNTDLEQHRKRFDDAARSFQPQNQEQQDFYTMVMHSFCAQLGEEPTHLRDFPFNVKRTAMKNIFTTTQDLIQSVQRQMQSLIERKDAYNVQVSKDWKTFRWSRMTLLSDPEAALISMKVHVFPDSILCRI